MKIWYGSSCSYLGSLNIWPIIDTSMGDEYEIKSDIITRFICFEFIWYSYQDFLNSIDTYLPQWRRRGLYPVLIRRQVVTHTLKSLQTWCGVKMFDKFVIGLQKVLRIHRTKILVSVCLSPLYFTYTFSISYIVAYPFTNLLWKFMVESNQLFPLLLLPSCMHITFTRKISCQIAPPV